LAADKAQQRRGIKMTKMKKILFAILLATPMSMHSSFAADAGNERQNKTEMCAKEASGKSGDARHEHMRNCVQEKAIEEKPGGTQEALQAKTKACTTEAGDRKGSDRKNYIKQCLKKK
jgi:Skp family chaperone for outer membrane proteins